MTRIQGSFTTAAQVSAEVFVPKGNRLNLSLFGTWTGAVILECRTGAFYGCYTSYTANGNYTRQIEEQNRWYRIRASMVSTGTINYVVEEGNATSVIDAEWDDLRFPAQSINPTGITGGAGVDDVETSFPGTLLFDSGTTEMVAGVAQMPHGWITGTPVRPHIHWAKTSTASGGVIWEFFYRLINRSSDESSWSNGVIGVDELSGADTVNRETITTFGEIDMTGRTPSAMLAWRLYRRPANASDTYAADARLFELDFHYLKGSLGTGLEYLT